MGEVGRKGVYEQRDGDIVGLFDDQRWDGADERLGRGVMFGEHRKHRIECDPMIDTCRLSGQRESQYLGDGGLEKVRWEFGHQDFEESGGIRAHRGVA